MQATAFQPGDIVNFARGSVWAGKAKGSLLKIDDNGTANQPITFRAYGSGSMPTFSNAGQWNDAITITADYVVFDGLKVEKTSYRGFNFASGADHNIAKNCEVSTTGVAFYVGNNSSSNLFTKNYIHDLIMVVDDTGPHCADRKDPLWRRNPCDNDFGCVSFWLYGPNNEISFNRSINNIQHSFDYQYDGGFIELYANTDGTYAHHNWVENGMGIVEASNGHGNNVTIAYNVWIENKGLFAIHLNNFKVANFKLENNTFITRQGTLWNNMFNLYPSDQLTGKLFVRNNIFVLGGKASERVARTDNFTHANNIYYLLVGAQMGAVSLGAGELIADPLFFDAANKDFRLKPGSPALKAGANLGYAKDYRGTKVPSGSTPDLGAYQSE